MTIVSEIKLIRTDTTLDLSQKAEKVCLGARNGLAYDAGCTPRAMAGGGSGVLGLDRQKHTSPAIPTWSPTAVLSRPNGA